MTTPAMFLYLQQEDVIACGGLDMPATMAAVEQCFALHEQGQVQEPLKSVIHWGASAGRRAPWASPAPTP